MENNVCVYVKYEKEELINKRMMLCHSFIPLPRPTWHSMCANVYLPNQLSSSLCFEDISSSDCL